MTKIKLSFLSLILVSLISGCTKDGAPVSAFINFDKNAVSVDNQVKPKLSGSSCSYALWPWATFGDSSVEAAKSNANISKVATLDKSHFSIFTWSPVGWFVRSCSVVSGE
jgi:hypothetical protein